MDKTRISILVILFLSILSQSQGQGCTWPTSWQHSWVKSYIDGEYERYWAFETTTVDEYADFDSADPILLSHHECTDSYDDENDVTFILMTEYSVGGTPYIKGYGCVKAMQSEENAILWAIYSQRSLLEIEECSDLLLEEPAFMFTLLPADIKDSSWPWAIGTYQLTYTDDTGTYCVDDQDSQAIFRDDTVEIQSCIDPADVSYEKPLIKTLRAAGKFPEVYFGHGGPILLLADEYVDNDRVYYWCVRYDITSDGKVTMSLNVGNADEVQCEYTKGYDAVGTNYLSIIIDPVFDVPPAASTAAPSTAAPTTAAPSTAAPSTAVPSTAAPTTAAPTTAAPVTTAEPGSVVPYCDFGSGFVDESVSVGYVEGFRATKTYRRYYYYHTWRGDKLDDVECAESQRPSEDNIYYTVPPHADSNDLTYQCFYEKNLQDQSVVLQIEAVSDATYEHNFDLCIERLVNETDTFNVLLKNPTEDFLTGIDCPFANGIYQVTISESASEFDICINDRDSTMSIDGAEMKITSCMSDNTYRKPYQTTLYCLDMIHPDDLDVNNVDAADGLYLLAGEKLAPESSEVLNYYIIRYTIEGEDIYMSFDVSNSDMIEGDHVYDSKYFNDQVDDRFRAFHLSGLPPTSTAAPSTAAPSTAAPSTAAPSTAAPSTAAPSTAAPSTAAPSTAAPSTAAPSTAAPSTAAPSTAGPSTAAPSTAAPSTAAPSTAAPSTAAPSTAAPSTAAPATAAPSTAAPSTAAPTTRAPEASTVTVEIAWHFACVIFQDYDEVVTSDQDRYDWLIEYARIAIAEIAEIIVSRVINVLLRPGSILLDCDILPSDDPADTTVEEAIDNLELAVAEGRLRLPLPPPDDGFLVPDPSSAVSYPVPDDPCDPDPCKNGGVCSNITISLYECDCPKDYTGTTCSIKKEDDDDNDDLIIAICVVAALVVILTVLALVCCSCWDRDRSMPKALQEDGTENLIATSWAVSYGEGTYPGKSATLYSNGGFTK